MVHIRLIRFLLFITSLSAPFFCDAQNSQVLKNIFEDSRKHDTTRLNAIHTLVTTMVSTNPDSAIILAKEQLELAKKFKQKKYIAHAFNSIAVAYENKNEFVHGVDYYQKSLAIWKELNNEKEQASCYTNIGILNEYQSDFPLALENYLTALTINEKIGDKKAMGYSNNDIGVIFMYQNKYSKALDYFFTALKTLELVDNTRGMANSYCNIGTTYAMQKKYKESEEYFLKALKLRKDEGDKRGMAGIYNNLAGIYANQQNPSDQCLKYFKEYLNISKDLNDKQSIGMAFVNIGILYYKTGEFEKAKKYCDTALNVGLEIGDVENQRIAYQYISNAHNKLGNYKEAYNAHVKFKALTDSIFNIDNSRQLSDLRTSYEVDKKETELRVENEKTQAIAMAEAKKQRIILIAVTGFAILGLVLAAMIFRNLRLNKQKNRIISAQKLLVEEKHKEITDSINYAERIQKSFLATKELLDENLIDYFVFFQPKDIVSGDFYWASKLNNGHFALVTADSTGHGVPGAIMSLLNITSLEKAIETNDEPSEILNTTRKIIIERLKKDGSADGGKDGMDCSLISFDIKEHKLTYAAANNPVWIVREQNILEFNPDKMPVGKHDRDNIPFSQHDLELKKGDVVYAITDGMPDQFGGPNGKKYKYKQLKELLITIAQLPMQDQKLLISNSLNQWKGEMEQVDDVTLIGIRI